MPGAAPQLVRVALVGASGRMGQALLRAAPAFADLIITAAVASADSLALGRDAGELAGAGTTNLRITSDLPAALAQADVALDFSSPLATAENLAACRRAGTPLLLGTTGYDAALCAQLADAARDIALLVAPNTSIAVALLGELTAQAARTLSGFDIDILEMHHRTKRDAPSGTALALAAAARDGLKHGAAPVPGAPPQREIAIASLRGGDIVGEHSVLFCGPGEQLLLQHRASDRAIFARGALTAALWLASVPTGLYAMRDFLASKTAA